MAKPLEDNLKDAGVERAVVAGMLKHGPDMVLDIADFLEPHHMSTPLNRAIFEVLKYLATEKQCSSFDTPIVVQTGKNLGYKVFEEHKTGDYIMSISDVPPESDNTLKMARCLFILATARDGVKCLRGAAMDIGKTTGEEGIDEIIAKIEKPIFDFTGEMLSHGTELRPIGQGFAETMKVLGDDPQDIVGLPTGFTNWDTAIGGGLRRGTVNVIGARPKQGKSFMCLNVARNLAKLGIPTLYLDTELTQELQLPRLTALITGLSIDSIESGKFQATDEESQALWACEEEISKLPITHCSIAGYSMQSVTSIVRRWLSKSVGFNEFGKANPCLVIYDYLKLMSSDDLKSQMQEFQMLGFLISAFHNFAVKWSLPILATVQLNRDGVEKEGGEFIAGSDRILWLCSNFTILKPKIQSDLLEDPPANGTMKLVVTDTRFGPGLEFGEYINVYQKLERGLFEEGLKFSPFGGEPVTNEKV